MYGFEILVGPYAVAHLRLTQALEGSGAEIKDWLKVYLADTLESPNVTPAGGLTLTYRALTQEHEAARKVKTGGDILVCLGNPPYDREQRTEERDQRRKGGWVRHGDQIEGGAKQEAQGERPIFEDFLEPARKADKGLYLQVIFNDYVYFWRWALWRLFEQQTCGGIVNFITASSYLSGPGFCGMREVMRRTFDALWILDLGGDNLGARKTPNVFAIQIPVTIAIGIRGKAPKPKTPAKVWYAKVEAPTRDAKLNLLAGIESFASVNWKACSDEWQAPFLPKGKGAYFDWPKITALFPYHTAGAGAVFYRTWPIGETEKVLAARWEKLCEAPANERKLLFKESRDRKIMHVVNNPDLPGYGQPAIHDVKPSTPMPQCIRYGFRTLDRQFAYFDFRLGDYIRPTLYKLAGPNQIFLVAPNSLVPSVGPCIVVSECISDQHFFRGSFGGRDVIPLYRDAAGTQPNVTTGILEKLGHAYGAKPSAEDLAAYVYALLGGQSYTKRFWNELETPGPRVPLTNDGDTFCEVAKLGRRLIWLHTYAERFRGKGQGEEVSQGAARIIKGLSSNPAHYPDHYAYDEKVHEIVLGSGRFGPVKPDVWQFEVSGLKVVQSWLGYRMKKRAGKKSSPLDDIRPERWTPKMSDELLELLWVLEATLAMEPQLAAALDKVVSGPCIAVSDLPTSAEAERKAPLVVSTAGGLLEMMAVEDEDADYDG